MAVKKRKLSGKGISWRYEFSVGPRGANERYIEAGFATREEALKAEAAKRLELANAKPATPEGNTLAGVIRRFIDSMGQEMSPKTVFGYRQLAAYVSPSIGSMAITAIRPMHLHEEWKRLKESGGHHPTTLTQRPLSAKTVRNIAGVVSSACAWAVLMDMIPHNPVTDSKPPRGGRREGLALTPSQTDLLIQAASGWLAYFLSILSGLGIRRGEALALRWSDIAEGVTDDGIPAVIATISRSLCQVKKDLLFKSTKGKRTRRIVIPDITLEAFAGQRSEQEKARAYFPDYRVDLDLVFAQPSGEPLFPDSVSAKVSALCRRLKFPVGASLHTLRHSHGSQLIAEGESIAGVSQRLGHSNTATTLGIYTHAMPGDDRKLARRWAEIQKGKSN